MRSFLAIVCGALPGMLAGCDHDARAGVTPDGEAVPDAAGDENDGEFFLQTSDDERALLACSVDDLCEFPTTSQIVEGSNVAYVATTACTFEALAERRPGRHVHTTDHTWTNGALGAKHTLLVRADGSALYSRVPYGGYVIFEGNRERFVPYEEAADPGARCTLKPPSYFEDCRVAIGEAEMAREGSAAYRCAFGDGDRDTTSHLSWFESCETVSPIACE